MICEAGVPHTLYPDEVQHTCERCMQSCCDRHSAECPGCQRTVCDDCFDLAEGMCKECALNDYPRVIEQQAAVA